jgi:surfeit locus 1 family protein
MIFLRMFSQRWLIATFLVIFGMGLTIRLGIWQLDRLEQRRVFNERVQTQLDQPTLIIDGANLPVGLEEMEYRQAQVSGSYDFSQQIALRNQYWGLGKEALNEWGVHLITPLIISGSDQAILVDRGWIPAAEFEAGDWSKFDEPGLVTVEGMIRASQTKAQMGRMTNPTPVPGQERILSWNFIHIEAIAPQMPYPLLPVYLQQAPDPAWTNLPYRNQPELELTEGPHMGYALQWFTFSTILGLGYPFFIRRQEKHKPS